jgi:hypothetical protein
MLRTSPTPPPAGRPASAWRFHFLVPCAVRTSNQRCLHVNGTATPTAVLAGGLVRFYLRRQHIQHSRHLPLCYALTRTMWDTRPSRDVPEGASFGFIQAAKLLGEKVRFGRQGWLDLNPGP